MDIAETRKEVVSEYQKSQNIRLIDVFVIAPVLFYIGVKQDMPKWMKISLITIGLATFYYNGKNYLVNAKNDQTLVK